MEVVQVLFILIISIALLAGGLYIYLLPTTIAYKKVHRNRQVIFCINVFLGWTLIGWIPCLIWALYEENPKTVNNNSTNNVTSNKYEDLERLQKLKENGTISEEEFEIEKQKILK